MKVQIACAVLMLLSLLESAAAAAPTCETTSTRELVNCLRPCSGRENEASARVCKQRCMEKHEARKEQCTKATKPGLIVF